MVVLQTKLAAGTWSAVKVCTAFLKASVVAHKVVSSGNSSHASIDSWGFKTNCLTEVFFDRALERAQALDDHLRLTGQVVGPLHGIPISVKDQVNVKDVETTLGK